MKTRQRTAIRCYANSDWRAFKEVINDGIDLRNCRFQTKAEIDGGIRDLFTLLLIAESITVSLKVVRPDSYRIDSEMLLMISLRNCLRRKTQRNHCPLSIKLVNSLSRKIRSAILEIKNEDWNRKLSNSPFCRLWNPVQMDRRYFLIT